MRLVLWGATGQAIVLAELFASSGVLVEALFDNDTTRESPLRGVPIFHGREGFASWKEGSPRGSVHGLVAIGGDRGADRIAIARFMTESGVPMARAIHRTAFVAADATIGSGSQILAMAAVASRASVGECCIVNTSASVDHECELGDGVHIAPGAHLAGSVIVESCAFIGIGAVVMPRVRIGRGSIVGAGSVVLRDVEPGAIVAGNPARTLRSG
jgi:sugar O-acyltransferase (sialic acid O-acetyltransferase NeuD family)